MARASRPPPRAVAGSGRSGWAWRPVPAHAAGVQEIDGEPWSAALLALATAWTAASPDEAGVAGRGGRRRVPAPRRGRARGLGPRTRGTGGGVDRGSGGPCHGWSGWRHRPGDGDAGHPCPGALRARAPGGTRRYGRSWTGCRRCRRAGAGHAGMVTAPVGPRRSCWPHGNCPADDRRPGCSGCASDGGGRPCRRPGCPGHGPRDPDPHARRELARDRLDGTSRSTAPSHACARCCACSPSMLEHRSTGR